MKINLISLVALAAVTSARSIGNTQSWSELRKNIKHVVYLTLENHSFDNIAGYWNFRDDIDNLINKPHCNEYTNANWTVWGEPLQICSTPFESEVPLLDPDHNFAGVTYEIFRKWDADNNDVPNMGGFVERQSEKYSATPGDASFVIKAYNQEKTALLAEIAQNFVFFDSYYAEHPGPTNTNRQFATSGSTCGMVDNTDQAAGFFANVTGTTCATSIFESLSKKGISWKNYYETDIIDAWIYKWVQDNAMGNLAHADQFYKDLEEGTLPTFSYINPECCSIDSMHPTSPTAAGEQMVKHLYDALRKSQYWDNVLLIVNFDEHGGFADHVPPPMNVPAPEDGITFNGESEGHNVTYDFTRLGIRVPAFLISPFVPANHLIHDEGTMYAKNSAYTHTSMLHFLQELWELEGLNNRVQWAKTFEDVFLSERRDDTPTTLTTPTWQGGPGQPEPSVFYKLNQDYSYYAEL
ncbi:phosphatidylglycerol specific phospholipase [Penicillium lagena]|uniref:phosphatidylglycerol specific phospholipase n=1 Tax=Penicillium lagena TaxID=94218 RepID=UPI0025410318|nr:phosphatidylglycerol specific phospholipase [Penicillium lagena]KAJ5601819.1 phosphatidylglycerol specific phospholipase [Penicillium lagena]